MNKIDTAGLCGAQGSRTQKFECVTNCTKATCEETSRECDIEANVYQLDACTRCTCLSVYLSRATCVDVYRVGHKIVAGRARARVCLGCERSPISSRYFPRGKLGQERASVDFNDCAGHGWLAGPRMMAQSCPIMSQDCLGTIKVKYTVVSHQASRRRTQKFQLSGAPIFSLG